jgi:hypothetical protein
MCFIAEETEELDIIADATPPEARIPTAVAIATSDRARRRGSRRPAVECPLRPSVARNKASLRISRAA